MKYIVIFLLISLGSHAQSENKSEWRVNILSPSLENEFALSESFSMVNSIGLTATGIPKELAFKSNGLTLIIAPFFENEFRYYHSKSDNKDFRFSSGNFFSIRSLYIGPEISRTDALINRFNENTFQFNFNYGWQRVWKGFNFQLSSGPALYLDGDGRSFFMPIPFVFQFNVGYKF